MVKVLVRPNWKKILLLSLFYFCFAALFTYPLVTHFFTHIPGGEEDGPTHVWLLWWFKFALFDKHINPIFTDYIFYPQVINRTFDIHTFVNAVISLPFQYWLGIIPASNIVFFLSFVLSGLGGYYLTNYLTKSNLASFVSGFIYSFSPFVLAQASNNHTNLTTIWFTPFYILFFLRLIEEKRLRWGILAGTMLGLQGLNDLTYTSFSLFLTALILLYYLVFCRQKILAKTFIKPFMFFVIVFALIFTPMLYLAIYTIAHGYKPDVPLYVQSVWSADVYYFLFPPGSNPFLKVFSKSPTVSSVEATMYIGYSTLTLSLMSIFLIVKDSKNRLYLGLFGTMALTFFILSLGPWLHFFGQEYRNVYLPFIIYQLLPLIGGIQEPLRFQPLTMLGLSVLSGYTLSYLLQKLSSRLAQVILTSFILILVTIEYLPIPFTTTNLTVPDIYKEISQESGDFVVLSLPVGWNTGNYLFGYGPIGTLQYYQTELRKKDFRGTVARLPVQNIVYYKSIPFLRYLADPTIGLTQEDTDKEAVKKVFKDLKIKYILINHSYYRRQYNRSLGIGEQLMTQLLDAKIFYDSEKIRGYRLEVE